MAQIAPPGPVRDAIDANGVDLFSGRMMIRAPGLTIGGADQGMSYSRVYRQTGWTDDLIATLDPGLTTTITQGLIADSFTLSGGVYTSTEGNGSTLTLSGQIYTYTRSDGTVIRFSKDFAIGFPAATQTGAQVADITLPDGTKYTFTYDTATYCIGVLSPQGCTQEASSSRLMSVQSSFGYKVSFTHARANPGAKGTFVDEWLRVTGANVTNLAGATGTPLASNSYASTTTTRTITDALGRSTLYTMNGNDLVGIRLPGSASDIMSIAYTSGRITSVTKSGVTSSYAASDASGIRTVTVTEPLNHVTTYKFNIASKRLTEVTNANGKTTTMQYDSNGRLTRTTMPEGNYVQLTYDGRGNVTESRAVSKTPNTPPDIVTTASFPASCTNPKTCNQPVWTKNAKGNQTDYTYDSGHGGVLTVTAPAPTVGAVRPQTRYSYMSLQAFYRNSGGSIVASGVPVLRLTGVSACQTTASCSGVADEVKTSISYGPQVAGTGNNLLPISTSSGAGDNSLTATVGYTYDEAGNLTFVDGPLSGTADVTRNRYNVARELVGTVAPDPDGAGPMKRRAMKFVYNPWGRLEAELLGTVVDDSDTAWNNFAFAYQRHGMIDQNDRVFRQTVWDGSANQSVIDFRYDGVGRLSCVITYMDPSNWTAVATSCQPVQTSGPYGPDRVTKIVYDAAGQVTQQQVAVGTADAATDAAFTYTNNGKIQTLKDGENNLTTYVYDGHDRLSQTQFPSPTKGAGTSNPSDYEQLGYDANSNVTNRRLRDATSIAFAYDNLNRPTEKDRPGGEPSVNYAYDNLGRLTSASQTGNALGFTYDALGRNLTQVGPQGTISSQWDIASRRTRLTWPDGFFVDYDYLVTGEMTKVRENGATSGSGVLATYAYDDLGRRSSLTRGNGAVTSYAYDPVSRLTPLVENMTGSAGDQSSSFAYNPAGQIGSVTRSNDAYAWTGHGSGSTATTVNGLNQITISGGSFLHDQRGNLTFDAANRSYAYSSENLLISSSASGTPSVGLGYDSLGRLNTVSATATSRFAYDGLDMIAEFDGSNNLVRRYVHGPGTDELLVEYNSSDWRYHHLDERGSVVAWSDPSGALATINRYDEYGRPQAGNIGRFQYTGQMWLPEVGLYHYKARAYAPHLGRFMQTDPIGYAGGINLYAYVRNDPVNLVDPLGLQDGPDISVTGYLLPRMLGGFGGSVFGGIGSSYDPTSRLEEAIRQIEHDACVADPNCGIVTGTRQSSLGLGVAAPNQQLACAGRFSSACLRVLNDILQKVLPRVRIPRLPPGVTRAEFGKMAGFGRSLDDLPIRSADDIAGYAENLKSAGFTADDIADWRNFYQDVAWRNSGNFSAAHRAGILDRIFMQMKFGW